MAETMILPEIKSIDIEAEFFIRKCSCCNEYHEHADKHFTARILVNGEYVANVPDRYFGYGGAITDAAKYALQTLGYDITDHMTLPYWCTAHSIPLTVKSNYDTPLLR